MRFNLSPEELRVVEPIRKRIDSLRPRSDQMKIGGLKGKVAEYVSARFFRRLVKQKYPGLEEDATKIWTPPLPARYLVHPCRRLRQTLNKTEIIENELLMPELKPIFEILKMKGRAPDLIAIVDLCEGKTERYFMEMKYGRSRLDSQQKLSQELARKVGYIPVSIRVKRMSLARNLFSVVVEGFETNSSEKMNN